MSGRESPDNARTSTASGPNQTHAGQSATPPHHDTAFYLMLALQAVLEKAGKTVSLNDLLATMPLPHKAQLADLVPLLRRLGFRARVDVFFAAEIQQLPVPFIIMAGEAAKIYAVTEVSGQSATVFDPELGREETRPLDALPHDGAQLLLLKPVHGAPETWKQLLFSRMRGVFGHIILASVLLNIFQLGAPLVSMVIFNKVLGHQALSTLNVLVIGAVALYGFDALLRALRGYISLHTGARLEAHMGSEVVAHLLRLPLRHFEITSSGVTSERLRQMDTLRAFLTGQMPMLLVDLFFCLILFLTLFLVDWRIGAFAAGLAPVFIGLSFIFDIAQKKYISHSFIAHANRASCIHELTANALTVKALGLESDIERRHGTILADDAHASLNSQNIANITNNVSNLLLTLSGLFTLYLGSRFVMDGSLTIGGLIAANMLAARALSPLRQVVNASHQLREAWHAFERLDHIMGQEKEAGLDQTPSYPRLAGDITFDGVGYSYDSGEGGALRDVSFHVPAGSIAGIVGASGSGKSTLGKILVGVYKPAKGAVAIGGLDISQVSALSLRRDIGYVPQENQLFAGTIRDNILLGVGRPTPARAVMAAQFAGAHDFIQNLPGGYDFRLGECGGGLSSGQRQMICIARALAREPRILILDEATSGIDLGTEERLLTNLHSAVKKLGLTILFITHRLNALKWCDQVIVLKDGALETSGHPGEVFPQITASAPVLGRNRQVAE